MQGVGSLLQASILLGMQQQFQIVSNAGVVRAANGRHGCSAGAHLVGD